jgi:hypothetical protein
VLLGASFLIEVSIPACGIAFFAGPDKVVEVVCAAAVALNEVIRLGTWCTSAPVADGFVLEDDGSVPVELWAVSFCHGVFLWC